MALKDRELKTDPNFIFALERNAKQYMFIIILIESLIIVLLTFAIFFMTPLKQKQPYLVFFSDAGNNFVRVEPANYDIRADETLLKSIIAGYVKKRETINRVDDAQRYEEVRLQSGSTVWQTFNSLVTQKGSIYSTQGIYRDIKIINTSILSNKVATVDFVATTMQTNTAEQTMKRYRATLSYGFQNQEITFDSVPENPTGFSVNEYALTEIDISQQPKQEDSK